MPPLRGSQHIRPWHWLTILSLDAPIVSVVWQDGLARVFQVELFAVHRVVLGFSVWLAYVADRWLDGRQLPAGGAVTARHAFAQRFARPIAVAWLLVFLGTVLLALAGLTQREFLAGLMLAAVVGGYLTACHVRGLLERFGWLKEFAVAALISGGAAIFVWMRSPAVTGVHGLATTILFLLCLLNCGAVSIWERTVDRRQGQPSLAGRFELQPPHMRIFALGLLVLTAVVAGFATELPLRRVALVGMAATVGTLGLLAYGVPLDLDSRRLLADATLLSPLLLLPFY